MQSGEKSEEGESIEEGGIGRLENGETQALMIPNGKEDDAHDVVKKRSAAQHQRQSPGGTGIASSSLRRRKAKPLLEKRKRASAADQHKIIKYVALFLLIAQMVGLVLLMRHSRTQRDPEQPLYLASTAVFIMEGMKLMMCLIVIAVQANGALVKELHTHVIQSPMEILKLCVPSLLYTVQNNLLYFALTNLDAATYQVCYQLKILTTAVFSVLLLHRKFSPLKWLSLIILTVGVAVVQISGSGDHHSSAHHHHDNDAAAADHHHHTQRIEETASMEEDSQQRQHNRFVGLVAVLCAACTSGFAGVWFEKILKGSRTSLWARNVQMGLPSTLIAYITVFMKDAEAVKTGGFWQGYNSIVWTVIIVQAVGGLVVAVVVKYADNVLKVFATSFSIVVSCVISAFLFDFRPNVSFVVGASLVVLATIMYSAPEPKRRKIETVALPRTHNSSMK